MSTAARTPRTGRRPAATCPDEVIVAELVAGRRPRTKASAADMAEAVRHLAGRSFSDGQIAYRLNVACRTVLRIRAAHHIPAGLPPGPSRNLPVDAPSNYKYRG